MSENSSTPSTSHIELVPDGFGTGARVGLVYMASSVVMEPEMYAMAGPDVSIHTSRVTLPKVTVDGIDAMMRSPELEAAVRSLAQAPLDVICFGGTSASFLHGLAWDRELVTMMHEWSDGIACTTTSTSSVAALDALGVGPISLVTPYVSEIVERARTFFGDNGHEVVASSGMDITSDHALAEVTPEQVYEAAIALDTPEATATFISCTNLRTIAMIPALERALGKPVVSATQASMWHSVQVAGCGSLNAGYGSLMSTEPARS